MPAIRTVGPNFEVNYTREYGVQKTSAIDGTPITSVSYPTWEEFFEGLANLPPTRGYIISPELITSPIPVKEIPAQREEIEAKTQRVVDISKNHPEAAVLLGSSTFSELGVVRNSLVALSNGELKGYIDKKGLMWFSDEAHTFSRQRRSEAGLMSEKHGAILCSDIFSAVSAGEARERGKSSIYENVMSVSTQTLIFSSCWAIKHNRAWFRQNLPDEEHFRGALETQVGKLFKGYPLLREVIVVDRVTPGLNIPPLNAHFRRAVPVS